MPVLAVTGKRTLIVYSRHKYSLFGPWSNVSHQELSLSSSQKPIIVTREDVLTFLESGNETGTKTVTTFFLSQSPHLIRCAGGEKYQELFGDMYLAVIV